VARDVIDMTEDVSIGMKKPHRKVFMKAWKAATEQKHHEGMRVLLEALKEWDDESEAIRTAKVERIISGNKEVVNCLVTVADLNYTPLSLTITGGFKETTALLLKH
jgi:hypothetical protein